jgi:hypothetical protein
MAGVDWESGGGGGTASTDTDSVLGAEEASRGRATDKARSRAFFLRIFECAGGRKSGRTAIGPGVCAATGQPRGWERGKVS